MGPRRAVHLWTRAQQHPTSRDFSNPPLWLWASLDVGTLSFPQFHHQFPFYHLLLLEPSFSPSFFHFLHEPLPSSASTLAALPTLPDPLAPPAGRQPEPEPTARFCPQLTQPFLLTAPRVRLRVSFYFTSSWSQGNASHCTPPLPKQLAREDFKPGGLA